MIRWHINKTTLKQNHNFLEWLSFLFIPHDRSSRVTSYLLNWNIIKHLFETFWKVAERFYKSWESWCGNWWCLEFLNIFDGLRIQKVFTEWIWFYRRCWNRQAFKMFRNVKHYNYSNCLLSYLLFLRKPESLLFRIIVCNFIMFRILKHFWWFVNSESIYWMDFGSTGDFEIVKPSKCLEMLNIGDPKFYLYLVSSSPVE